MQQLLKQLLDWYLRSLETGGLWLVGLLMVVESTVLPIPSELVIPPAAHLAHTKGDMTVWGVMLAGTVGSWLGATLMYWVSRVAGRPLALRFGKYVLISPEKIEGAERWASHYGSMGIFISRLLPVVRHLIGIPAGIVRMDFRKFSLFTLAGSAVWCAVLCWVGVKMGEDLQKTENMAHTLSLWCGGIVVAIGALYYLFVHRHMKRGAP
jgi:membrane protein DedA with SNARE-associated domain